ncbi:hypothetical protein D3C80_1842970 [compost metagenome]
MGLHERDDRTGLECDDVQVHVVSNIRRIDETRRRPAALGIRHRIHDAFVLMREYRRRRLQTFHDLECLAHPMKAAGLVAFTVQGPFRTGRKIGE